MQRSVVMEALPIKGSTRVISECERLQRYTMIPGTDSPFEKSRTCYMQLNPEKESYLTNTWLLKGSADLFIKYFSDKIKLSAAILKIGIRRPYQGSNIILGWLSDLLLLILLIFQKNIDIGNITISMKTVSLYLNNSCLYRLICP